MTDARTRYSRLDEERLPRFGGHRAWRAEDHLLIAQTRFFVEHYTRLYWGDIQFLLLYRLERPQGFLAAAEWVCLASPMIAALWALSHGVTSQTRRLALFSVLFAIAYSAWRWTRFGWGGIIATRTSGARLPIALSLGRAKRVITALSERVSDAQAVRKMRGSVGLDPAQVWRAPEGRWFAPHEPILILHGIVFGFGLLQWTGQLVRDPALAGLFVGMRILYYAGLAGLYFLQQDFEFPFAVRSAAVMSQILAALSGGLTLLDLLRMGDAFFFVSRGLPFSIVQGVFSLYGLSALYARSVAREPSKPQPSRSVLGLDSH